MKHRLTYLLVLVVMALGMLVGSLWHPPAAYASGEDYVDYNAGSTSTLYARNGVFNGLATFTSTNAADAAIPSGLQSTYNSIVNNPTANFSDGTYVGTYTCKTSTVYALIGLTKGAGTSDTAALYILGSTGGALSGSGTRDGTWVKNNGCAPAHANTNGYTGSPQTFSIPFYSGLSTSDGNDWYNFLTSHGQTVQSPGEAKVTGTGGGTGSGSGDSTGADTPQCETSGFAFSWFFCQVINGLSGAIGDLYNSFVQPFLETKPINVANPQNDPNQTYNIWKNFRLYGDIFLVIALLVVVFGESIGGGMIDAYTAKKILPRLLVAAILINISIYLIAFAIDLTNIIGNGIGELIEQPFKAAGDFQLRIGGGTASFGLGAVTATGLWAIFAGGALLEFLLLFFLIPAFLAMLAVLITIIVRTGLIVFLVLISPVAFALYCLPNTEKYFRQWWDLLFRTLLIYPIIAVVFALANVLAITINSAASTAVAVPIAQLLSVIALFVPLFLIPYSFRIAGGMLGRLHDVATNARKQGHEALKGNANDPNSWRNKVQRNLKARNADMNLSGKAIVNQVKPSDFSKGGLGRRRARLAGIRNAYQSFYGSQGMQAMMYDQYKDDSNVTGDLALYGSGAESRAAAKADLDSGKIDKEDYQQRLFSSSVADRIGRSTFMRRKALTNPATIGYAIAGGTEGWDQAMGVAQELSGGDPGIYRSLQNEFQYVAKTSAGRPDLSRATDGKPETLDQAWGTGQIYGLGSVKPRALNAFGTEFLQQYRTASRQPMTEDVQKQITDAGRFYLEQQAIIEGGATGAARDAAMKNIRDFRGAGIESALDTEAVHGRGTKQIQVRDPSTGKIDVKTVPITLRDQSKEGMRKYDRDPNREEGP